MAFDFGKAEKASAARKRSPTLGAILLGPSSAGKSYLAGTAGIKTLYLYVSAEEHGVDSARIEGADIVAVALDYTEEGDKLKADAAYKRTLAILSDVAGIKAAGFELVVLDGLSQLEQVVRETSQWKLDCLSKEGAHNGFAEPAATVKALTPILDSLRTLAREVGAHYYVTCILDVKKQDSEDLEILDSEPQLLGYKVPSTLIPTFPDQLVIGRMLAPDGKEVHRLQFQAGVGKVSADNKTKEVKKFVGFTPRLSGVPSDKLPRHMKADLKEVIALKANGGKK